MSQRVKAGDIAGTYDKGYVIIQYKGYRFPAHQVAYFMVHGIIIQPDHKNRKCDDNRIDNLRPATTAQNSYNKSPSGSLMVKGVTKRGHRYIAQITHDGINYYLGTFDTVEEAKAVYNNKARELFGEFAGG